MNAALAAQSAVYPCTLGCQHHVAQDASSERCEDGASNALPQPVAFKRTPLWRRLDGVFEPVERHACSTTRVPLALHFDDVANALSVSTVAHGGKAVGGSALTNTLLVLGWVFAWGLGTLPALKNTAQAPAYFRTLRQDRVLFQATLARLLRQLQAGKDAVVNRQLLHLSALLQQHATMRRTAMARVAFSGGAAMMGTFLTGGAAGMELLHDVWPTAEMLAVWGMRLGAPLMGLFAVGSSAEQVHRLLRSRRGDEVTRRARQLQALRREEIDVGALLQARRRELFWQSAGFMASLSSMGVGINLIAFYGPQGIWPLIPGVVGMCVASYTEHENMCYRDPLSASERANLRGFADIVQRLVFAHQDYVLLGQVKRLKRRAYPWAASAPWLLGVWPRGFAWIAAKLRPVPASPPSARAAVLAYFGQRLALEERYLDAAIALLDDDLARSTTCCEAVAERLQLQHRRRDSVRATLAQVHAEAATETAQPRRALRLLLDFLLAHELFAAFALRLVNGARAADNALLRQHLGLGCEVSAERLIQSLNADTPRNRSLVNDLYGVGEAVLVTLFKARRHSRVREMCDLLLGGPLPAPPDGGVPQGAIAVPMQPSAVRWQRFDKPAAG